MMQTLCYWVGDQERRRELPAADEMLLPGVKWGEHWALFTPAYWLSQLWMAELDQHPKSHYQARGSLNEEIVFCMLGGYGITAELATSAFVACQESGLINEMDTSPQNWVEVLTQPLPVSGKTVGYRYPNQKGRLIAEAMASIKSEPINASVGRHLRDRLLKVKGIGPKTAGWIARNYLDADDVAILDIHLIRAGLLCDLFSPTQRVERDYFSMETLFLEFCAAMKVRPAILDCLIWDQMREAGPLALDALRRKLGGDTLNTSGFGVQPPQMRLI